jgi:hypothetical protein
MSVDPAALTFGADGLGSPKDSMTAKGLWARAMSRSSPEAPCDEAASDLCIACGCELPLKPITVSIPSSDETETTRLTDSRRELPTRYEVHRGEQYRVLDPEQSGMRVLHGFQFLAGS